MEKIKKLESIVREMGSMLVAYSGGVDSALLLAVSSAILGDKVLAVTAASELSPPGEVEEAAALARSLGAKHLIIRVKDLENDQFTANTPERCYYCKKQRFLSLKELAAQHSLNWVAEGSNVDDLRDYRPGHKAVTELGIRSPLLEAGLTKAEIRQIARDKGLSVWNKPAMPCLVTRLPYGVPITPQTLQRIGQAESLLSELLGIKEIRVREHGDIARLEMPREHFAQVLDPKLAGKIYKELKELGYSYIALDILGYRQGSMNENIMLPEEGLTNAAR